MMRQAGQRALLQLGYSLSYWSETHNSSDPSFFMINAHVCQNRPLLFNLDFFHRKRTKLGTDENKDEALRRDIFHRDHFLTSSLVEISDVVVLLPKLPITKAVLLDPVDSIAILVLRDYFHRRPTEKFDRCTKKGPKSETKFFH